LVDLPGSVAATGGNLLADPARRGGGRRRFNSRDYQPALDQSTSIAAGV
jgi:hypothetical protein